MKSIVKWAVSNLPAMNILTMVVLLVGYWSLTQLKRETFPDFDLDMVSVMVSYPGATPEEVEESICQKIEENIRDIKGIKKITSAASENVGSVSIEMLSDVDDPMRVLNEVDSAVGRISTFPQMCERPVVQLAQVEETIIRVGILGPPDWSTDAQLRLRDVAERIRMEMLRLGNISRVDIVGGKDYQIDVEFDENTLRSYGLTLQEVANIIAQENHQQAGGTIRGKSQEVLLRSDTKQDVGSEIAKLPLIGVSEGAKLTVGDLAYVRDEFVDEASSIAIRTIMTEEEIKENTIFSEHGNTKNRNSAGIQNEEFRGGSVEVESAENKKPGNKINSAGEGKTKNIRFSEDRPFLALAVQRNPDEDLFAMIDSVYEYLQTAQVPQGYDLITWGDRSSEVRERLSMLAMNGLQGLLIVFFCLTLFLDLRLSIWVALGIPFSLLGTCYILMTNDMTLNLISSFAFLMGLGIVVDDAIVVGENIFTYREKGYSTKDAAIYGTLEVLPSVISSIATTIIAFMPLLFVAGVMGKMMYTLPLVIISMLLISLMETMTILPAHLSHKDNLIFRIFRYVFYIFRWVFYLLQWMAKYAAAALEFTIKNLYRPTLVRVMNYRGIFVCTCMGIMILTVAMLIGGVIPFVFFPRMDSTSIVANLQFPNGTPEALTQKWAEEIEDAYWRVSEKIFQQTGEQISIHSIRTVGSNMAGRAHGGGASGGSSSHMASVEIQLTAAEKRSIESYKIVDLWREETGTVPGALVLTFDSAFSGPGGNPIEFMLVAPSEYSDELEMAVAKCKEKLKTYDGVFDIRDNNIPGKWEFQPTVKEFAATQGVRQADVAEVLRNAYYGAEVMRLQRGRHEVKLMVRYPEEARRSLASYDELRVRIGDVERPIGELADVKIKRGYSTINRINQQRAITITANIDDTKITANQVIRDLKGETKNQRQNAGFLTGTAQANDVTEDTGFLPQLKKDFPHIDIRWEGQKEQEEESFNSLKFGFAAALLGMFVLLSMEFKSYTQPLIILSVIPFAGVVVLLAHAVTGMQLTFMGVFGLIALAGIVVNDAIILIDFANRMVREEGMSVQQACIETGVRRFRPVVLTTVTTVGGLLPICFETSFQAQMVIPMAFTMASGCLGATVLTLFLVPVLFSLYDQFSTFMTQKLHLEHD
ncbi:MAG: efflux RND transporter permease subunit [Planctomycetia bacterium]|nr:efflux RND transporter permease subunit [Planctomycetia bacterium]